jgi:hypothetical protein
MARMERGGCVLCSGIWRRKVRGEEQSPESGLPSLAREAGRRRSPESVGEGSGAPPVYGI